MVTLYQFPISHFCEKARWALDYKGVIYQSRNLLPGPHVRAIKRIAPRSTVPVLVDGHQVIQNSAAIITYLDERHPQRLLTPVDADPRAQALEWEAFVDEEIGIHLRRLCYHTLLEHPGVTIPMLTTGGPWYGPTLIRLVYPKLVEKMRRLMKINADTAKESENRVRAAVDRLYEHLQGPSFLVGDTFTRADLAAAALLAPICRPAGYGIDWPDAMPSPLQEISESLSPKLGWVNALYRSYRAQGPLSEHG